MEDVKNHFSEKITKKNKKINRCEWLIEKIYEEELNDYYWFGFTGGNVSVPRKLLEVNKGFDEEFGLNWGYEDFELGYRLWRQGVEFRYSYDAAVYHMAHYRSTTREETDVTSSYFVKKVPIPKMMEFTKFVNGDLGKETMLEYLNNRN